MKQWLQDIIRHIDVDDIFNTNSETNYFVI